MPPGAVKNPSPWECNTLWGKHDGSAVQEQTSPGSRLSLTPCLFTWIFSPQSLLFLHRWLKQLSPFLPRCSLAPACSPGHPSWILNPCQAGGFEQGSTPSSKLQCNPSGEQRQLPGVPAWLSRQIYAVCRGEINNRLSEISPNLTWVNPPNKQRTSVPLGVMENLCSAQAQWDVKGQEAPVSREVSVPVNSVVAPGKCERCCVVWRPGFLCPRRCVWGTVWCSCCKGALTGHWGWQGWPWRIKHPEMGICFPRLPPWAWHSLSQQREHCNLPRLWGMRGSMPYTSDGLLPSQNLRGLKYLGERQFQIGATGLSGRQSRDLMGSSVGVWWVTSSICGAIVTAAPLVSVRKLRAEPKQGLHSFMRSEIPQCLSRQDFKTEKSKLHLSKGQRNSDMIDLSALPV